MMNPWIQMSGVLFFYGLTLGLAELYKRSNNKSALAYVAVWAGGALGFFMLAAADGNIGAHRRVSEFFAFGVLTLLCAVTSYPWARRRYGTTAFTLAAVVFGCEAVWSIFHFAVILGT